MKKLLLIVSTTLVLAACGGGGGGESTTPAPTPKPTPTPDPVATITVSGLQSSYDIAESTTLNIDVSPTYTGKGTLSYSATSDNDNITVAANNNGISITSLDIQSLTDSATIALTITDGTVSTDAQFVVDIQNTSIESTLAIARNYFNDAQVILSNNQIETVAARYIEQAYLLNYIDKEQAALYISTINANVVDVKASLEERFDALATSINNLSSPSAESNIEAANTAMEKSQTQFTGAVNDLVQRVNAIIEADTSDMGLGLPALQAQADLTPGEIYVFLNNEQYGSTVGDSFAFNSDYQLFSVLIEQSISPCRTL